MVFLRLSSQRNVVAQRHSPLERERQLYYVLCMPNLTAFVLAGGKSSRMGHDKAFAGLGGKTLLERAVETMAALTKTVRIVGMNPRLALFAAEHGIPLIEDRFSDRGPLGGIHAALLSSQTDLNFVLSVDTPFVTPACARFLVDIAAGNDALATVPNVGGIHPVSAVYRRAFAGHAERALSAGHNKIGALLEQLPVTYVSEDQLCRAGFAPGIFDNLNTPDDLARAASRLANPE
jgi:molybdopterin-guanine dinucleotide biosynthesis protein A